MLFGASVIGVEQNSPKWLPPESPSSGGVLADSCLFVNLSLRSESDPRPFQTTSVLGFRVSDFACLFKSKVSIFHSSSALQKASIAAFKDRPSESSLVA